MAKKNVTASYQGDYIDDMVDTLVASVLSGNHAVLLSKPGYGKTRVAVQVATSIYGQRIDKNANGKSAGEWAFLRLEASTPPEEVKGLPDPAAMIATPPRIEYNRSGTLYDTRAKLFVVDEGFRANDVVFDSFLDALDRQDYALDQAPSIWMTSNFVPTGDRLAAVRDRLAIWMWVSPVVDWHDVSMAHLIREYGQDLAIPTDHIPTPEQVIKIRSMRPTKRSANLIADMVNKIASGASPVMSTPEHINPRRVQQWSSILFHVSAYYYDTPDFVVAHPSAVNAIKYAWPSYKEGTGKTWKDYVEGVADAVGSAITAAKEAAYNSFNYVVESSYPPSQKVEELGKALAQAQAVMKKMGSDPRIQTSLNDIAKAYAEAATRVTTG